MLHGEGCKGMCCMCNVSYARMYHGLAGLAGEQVKDGVNIIYKYNEIIKTHTYNIYILDVRIFI
jgi:hypothetical protein